MPQTYVTVTNGLRSFKGLVVSESQQFVTVRDQYGVEHTCPRHWIRTAEQVLEYASVPGAYCPECGSMDVSATEPQNWSRPDAKTNHECNKCGNKFSEYTDPKYTPESAGNDRLEFKCRGCGLGYHSRRELAIHQRSARHHKVEDETVEESYEAPDIGKRVVSKAELKVPGVVGGTNVTMTIPMGYEGRISNRRGLEYEVTFEAKNGALAKGWWDIDHMEDVFKILQRRKEEKKPSKESAQIRKDMAFVQRIKRGQVSEASIRFLNADDAYAAETLLLASGFATAKDSPTEMTVFLPDITMVEMLKSAGIDSEISERSSSLTEGLEEGQMVKITGNVVGNGQLGKIKEFAPSGSFAIVMLKDGSTHSYHISDLGEVDYDDFEDEDFDESVLEGSTPPKWVTHPDIWQQVVDKLGDSAGYGAWVAYYKNKLKALGLTESNDQLDSFDNYVPLTLDEVVDQVLKSRGSHPVYKTFDTQGAYAAADALRMFYGLSDSDSKFAINQIMGVRESIGDKDGLEPGEIDTGKESPTANKDRKVAESLIIEGEASDKAKKLGLKSMGFGRWGKDGKVTHKSKGDDLVEIKPGEEDEGEEGSPESDEPESRSSQGGGENEPRAGDGDDMTDFDAGEEKAPEIELKNGVPVGFKPPKKGYSYAEPKAKDVLYHAGGKDKLLQLGDADAIYDKLSKIKHGLEDALLKAGYSEVGELSNGALMDLADNLAYASSQSKGSNQPSDTGTEASAESGRPDGHDSPAHDQVYDALGDHAKGSAAQHAVNSLSSLHPGDRTHDKVMQILTDNFGAANAGGIYQKLHDNGFMSGHYNQPSGQGGFDDYEDDSRDGDRGYGFRDKDYGPDDELIDDDPQPGKSAQFKDPDAANKFADKNVMGPDGPQAKDPAGDPDDDKLWAATKGLDIGDGDRAEIASILKQAKGDRDAAWKALGREDLGLADPDKAEILNNVFGQPSMGDELQGDVDQDAQDRVWGATKGLGVPDADRAELMNAIAGEQDPQKVGDALRSIIKDPVTRASIFQKLMDADHFGKFREPMYGKSKKEIYGKESKNRRQESKMKATDWVVFDGHEIVDGPSANEDDLDGSQGSLIQVGDLPPEVLRSLGVVVEGIEDGDNWSTFWIATPMGVRNPWQLTLRSTQGSKLTDALKECESFGLAATGQSYYNAGMDCYEVGAQCPWDTDIDSLTFKLRKMGFAVA